MPATCPVTSLRAAPSIRLVAALCIALTACLGAASATGVRASAAGAYSPPAARPGALSAGYAHTLALTTAGTVRAWGYNYSGQLGDGSTDTRTVPTTVTGVGRKGVLSRVVQVSAGFQFSSALIADGTVRTWGDGYFGELGDGSTASQAAPVGVRAVSGSGALGHVSAVSAGENFELALLSDGTVLAWGDGEYGQLGDASTASSSRPVRVRGYGGVGVLSHIVAISAGGGSAYALTSTGHVLAWGYGTDGELGDGGTASSTVPVYVSGVGGPLSDVRSLAAGAAHVLALRDDGTVVAWGYNSDGRLGDGTTTNRTEPVPVPALGNRIASVFAGSCASTSFALTATGAVLGWGDNVLGQVGDGTVTNRVTPVRVATFGPTSGVMQLAAGGDHSAAAASTGRVFAWGWNSAHQLGDGTTVDSSTPVRPYGLPAVGVPRLFLLRAPALGGHARIGYTLTVTAGTWGLPATRHAYRWLRDGKAITGATGPRYRVVAADRRHRLSVRVAASRSGYPGNATVTRAVYIAR